MPEVGGSKRSRGPIRTLPNGQTPLNTYHGTKTWFVPSRLVASDAVLKPQDGSKMAQDSPKNTQ
eukprot:9472035-Pyramimonas_sp.AAC.1